MLKALGFQLLELLEKHIPFNCFGFNCQPAAPLHHGYITEKVWNALIRGTIPIFRGTADIYEQLPCPDGSCILDVDKYPSAEDLAHRMAQIASDEGEWEKMRAWRHTDPEQWPEGFRRLISVRRCILTSG